MGRFTTLPCVPAKRAHVEHARVLLVHTEAFEATHGDVLMPSRATHRQHTTHRPHNTPTHDTTHHRHHTPTPAPTPHTPTKFSPQALPFLLVTCSVDGLLVGGCWRRRCRQTAAGATPPCILAVCTDERSPWPWLKRRTTPPQGARRQPGPGERRETSCTTPLPDTSR